ncbi:MAG: hypothetical protein RL213_872 [Bacteroidota bacterium]
MSYRNIPVAAEFNKQHSLSVVFQDHRSAVISGDEKPTFCGHMYSTAQIAYNIQTTDNLPLAEEFASALSESLKGKGFDAGYFTADPVWPADSVLKHFVAGEKQRLLFFTIQEWESRSVPQFSTIRYEVHYSLSLDVYDRNGSLLCNAKRSGTVEKQEGAMGSLRTLQLYSETVLKENIQQLLDEANIRRSLAGR